MTPCTQLCRHACVLSLLLASSIIGFPSTAWSAGLLEDATATLNTRNVFYQNDYQGSDVSQAKRQSWGQGFTLMGESGYTPGALGVGFDVIGKWAMKLDGGEGTSGGGMFPRNAGGPPAEYGRLGGAVKVRVLRTVIKLGEQTPATPVLRTNDARLIPQTYLGTTLASSPLEWVNLYAGHIDTFSNRDSTNQEKLHPHGSSVTGDYFEYAGSEFNVLDRRLQLGYWHAQLKNVYAQNLYRLTYNRPLGPGIVGFDTGYYSTSESGQARAGELDNRSVYGGLSWRQGGHFWLLGYQHLFGKDDFIGLQDSPTVMTNHVQNIFGFAHERSWQLRYDYDFTASGLPGLVVSVKYVAGRDVQRAGETDGREWERDFSARYVIQSGKLRDLNFSLSLSTLRSTFQQSYDEAKLSIGYPIRLF